LFVDDLVIFVDSCGFFVSLRCRRILPELSDVFFLFIAAFSQQGSSFSLSVNETGQAIIRKHSSRVKERSDSTTEVPMNDLLPLFSALCFVRQRRLTSIQKWKFCSDWLHVSTVVP